MSAFDTLRAGEFAVGTMVMTDSVLAAEVAARAGFDFLCLDRQHGLIDDATLWNQIAALRLAGKADCWVRVPWNEPASIMRALDGGAAGIIAPMINDAAEARALVEAARYPPLGGRSWGPVRSGMDDPVAYTETANDAVFVAAMVETAAGYENVQAIAATSGLDAVFVGPNDLSLAISTWQSAMPTDPDFIAALKRIAAVARDAGKLAGIHCSDAEMARAVRGWGYGFVTIAADIAFISRAGAETVAAARKD
jgi:4-hydroxy-2-oxoheptanedioate aldolase